jgi:hypothetical protein
MSRQLVILVPLFAKCCLFLAAQSPGPMVASEPQLDPGSLFDAAAHRIAPVASSVEVKAGATDQTGGAPQPISVTAQEIQLTAGTYGDLMRFMQTQPGVVSTSDTTNQMLVRGGQPIENLYLVEGFEIPNLNHVATLGTTGGFGPMIDTAAVRQVKLSTGGYDATFPERLSSVTEISLLENRAHDRHLEADFGIQGIGGLFELPMLRGDLLSSVHHGLLNVVTSDAGMNGVPSYTDALTSYRREVGSNDRLSFLNITGWDGIEVTPCVADYAVTSSIQSQYSGWRETTGAQWQHVHSGNSFSVLTLSDSEQIEQIEQQDQFINPAKASLYKGNCPIPKRLMKVTPVYSENTNDASSTMNYRYEWGSSRFWISMGVAGWLKRPNFTILSPLGALSPYGVTDTRTDATTIRSDFATGETGSYLQASFRPLNRLSLAGGVRVQTLAFGGHQTVTPRLSARYSLGESVSAHIGFAGYAQLPPYVYLVAYQQNRSLLPMRATHEVAGLDFGLSRWAELDVEGYRKRYSDMPTATEYSSVTLQNMPDLLGEQFVWLPMSSTGSGHSSGIEVSGMVHSPSRFMLRGSVAYSKTLSAGLDRKLRPSNYDLPWIVNLVSNMQVGRGLDISGRYGFATGRPYTPYDLHDSLLQNRPIYDLTSINALRAPFYGRLDMQISKDFSIRNTHLEIYGGVDNVLNRSNFLTYAWMPLYTRSQRATPGQIPMKEIYQMPIFPNFGVRMIFR